MGSSIREGNEFIIKLNVKALYFYCSFYILFRFFCHFDRTRNEWREIYK